MSEYAVAKCDYCGEFIPTSKALLGWRDAEEIMMPDRTSGAEPGAYAVYVVYIPAVYCGPYCDDVSWITDRYGNRWPYLVDDQGDRGTPVGGRG